MNSLLDILLSPDFLFTSLRVMTPILFAALACLIFNKSGINPIATEGIMLMSALVGVLAAHYTGHYIWGIVIGMLCGALLGLLFLLIITRLQSNPILSGIALNTLAAGITVFTLFLLTGEKGSSQSLPSPIIPKLTIPLIKDIPFLGAIISGQSLLTYLGITLVVITYLVIYRSVLGVRIRAVGYQVEAARSAGIAIGRIQSIGATMAGSLAGLGGVFMSMAYLSNFTRDMVAGRGFIGMAAEAMGRGTPLGTLVSAFFFGLVDSFAIRLQSLNLPNRLVQALPYLMTIIAISLYSYRASRVKASVKPGVKK